MKRFCKSEIVVPVNEANVPKSHEARFQVAIPTPIEGKNFNRRNLEETSYSRTCAYEENGRTVDIDRLPLIWGTGMHSVPASSFVTPSPTPPPEIMRYQQGLLLAATMYPVSNHRNLLSSGMFLTRQMPWILP